MQLLLSWFKKLKFWAVPAATERFSNIVAARVVKISPHPNADRLQIVSADIGSRVVEPIVCGAKNFDVGSIVALALPGARILQDIHSPNHESFVLSKATIRGVESQGMICASFELALGPLRENPGIMVLKNSVRPGTPFSSVLVEHHQ